MKNINIIASKTTAIILLGFLFGYFFPSIISYNTNGYTQVQLSKTLQEQNSHKSQLILIDSSHLNKYKEASILCLKIDKKIDSLKCNIGTITPMNVLTEINNYEKLKEKINTDCKMKIAGFSDNRIAIVWPLLIISLLIINSIVLPTSNSINKKKFYFIFLSVCSFLVIPAVFRNTEAFGQNDRIIFSVFNVDINKYMYYYQLLLYFLLIGVLVTIWLKSEHNIEKALKFNADNFNITAIDEFMSLVKEKYYSWQIFSFLLFVAFGTLLYHFYYIVFIDGDRRYLLQAVIFNILYLLTWTISSAPIYVYFQKWNSYKQRIYCDKEVDKELQQNGINSKELRKLMPTYEIASTINKTVSLILSSASFFLPLIKVLTK